MDRVRYPAFAIALMLLLASPAVHAGGSGAAMTHATSVAEMLQSKQEAQLREQLAMQGRWDAVRELDQAQAQRLEAQKKRTLTKINGQLAATTPVDTPAVDSMGILCMPPRAAIPSREKTFATGPAAANQGTMHVR